MKFNKPNFWDYKKITFMGYLLLPLSLITNVINGFKKNKKRYSNVKTICIGNIYVGGTGKTPMAIEIKKILDKEKIDTAFIKKKYFNQIDEQKILIENGKLFCEKERCDAIEKAIKEGFKVVILDDGLQDSKLKYDISFVCFNAETWIGNGLLLPAGPLRESLKSLKKYDAVFLNGSSKKIEDIKKIILDYNPLIQIFSSEYTPTNLEKFNINSNYLVFSGIGNPKNFKKTLKDNNFKTVEFNSFPDHYNYTNNDIEKIKTKAKNLNAKILTTKKDYMRLSKNNSKDIEYLDIKLKIQNKDELINFIKSQI